MTNMSVRRAWVFVPVFSFALGSCNGPVPVGASGGNGGGSSAGDTSKGSGTGTGSVIDLNPGATGTSTSTGTDINEAQSCQVKRPTTTLQPTDLLLILDRSSSMQNAIGSNRNCARNDNSCQTRWAVVQSTLKQVLTVSADSGVNWGLLMFSSPGKGSCMVDDAVQVEVGPKNAALISEKISEAGTATSTPTRKAVDAGVKYLQGLKGAESKSIVLATDGEPNCADDVESSGDDVGPTTAAIKAAADAGFKVYILGIGPDTSTETLNGFADAGGTAVKDVSGPGKNYYAALSAEELSKHFTSIVGAVASCTFKLDAAPDPSVPVVVEFDDDKNKRAPQDKTNGWDFTSADHKTIQLYGSWCDGLMDGTYKESKVLVGCPGQPIP